VPQNFIEIEREIKQAQGFPTKNGIAFPDFGEKFPDFGEFWHGNGDFNG
jgi:hypothetical protein